MSTRRRVSLYLMAALYLAAGVMHFARPDFYVAIMPSYLPWHAELVALSGAIEIALGLALLVPRTRVLAAWGVIALLIAVFPANVHMAVHDVFGYGWRSWARLPLQIPLVYWAWVHTRTPTHRAPAEPG